MSEVDLQKLKRGYSKAEVEDFNGIEIVSVNKKHLDWLFKQAEKVEQLQKTNSSLNHEIGAYSGKVHLIAEKLLNLEKEMLKS